MHTIQKEKVIYLMSPDNPPVTIVKPGESVCFETNDCFENQFDSPDVPYNGIDWSRINPATGPIYIDNAEPGDILVVQIEEIKIDDKGVIFSGPNVLFKDSIHINSLKRVKIMERHIVFNDKLRIPINPMIGVIGTAPSQEAISNSCPGDHGGNMDCKEIKEGSTLYLPVNVNGGLLALGDLHAVMGDGEVTSGVEVSGQVTLKLELIKNTKLSSPMIVTDDRLIFIASSDELEKAVHKSVNIAKDWLVNELSIDLVEASMLLSISGDVKICQVVNPLITVRMELPTWILDEYGYEIPYAMRSRVSNVL